MKRTNTPRILLGLALLGALALAPTMTSIARADAPDATNRDFNRDDNRRDNNETWRDDDNGRDKGERPDRFDGREQSRRADFGRRGDKGPRRADFEQRSDKGERPRFEGRVGERGRADIGRRGPARDENVIGRNRPPRRDEQLTIVPQFSGIVSKVKSDSEFDVRIGDKTYNVYLSGPANRVSVGQTVGLNGQRVGNNDIRGASLLQPRRPQPRRR